MFRVSRFTPRRMRFLAFLLAAVALTAAAQDFGPSTIANDASCDIALQPRMITPSLLMAVQKRWLRLICHRFCTATGTRVRIRRSPSKNE